MNNLFKYYWFGIIKFNIIKPLYMAWLGLVHSLWNMGFTLQYKLQKKLKYLKIGKYLFGLNILIFSSKYVNQII